jgi:hypothetical protein
VPHFDRSEDHLYSHKSKHAIAFQEVIVMGGRLPAAIGADRIRSFVDLAESGGLVDLREAALLSAEAFYVHMIELVAPWLAKFSWWRSRYGTIDWSATPATLMHWTESS